jgi:hypothetical protein
VAPVERHDRETRRRDADVGLNIGMAVGRENRDAIAAYKAEAMKRARKALAARGELAVGEPPLAIDDREFTRRRLARVVNGIGEGVQSLSSLVTAAGCETFLVWPRPRAHRQSLPRRRPNGACL